ncbi:n1r/p28-like protein [Albatrosspox virus]|nr:n1r/p28-like protein [Penguinpox virus 2]QRM16190.1 n1r/p28-like protein [Albatrosspox virus]
MIMPRADLRWAFIFHNPFISSTVCMSSLDPSSLNQSLKRLFPSLHNFVALINLFSFIIKSSNSSYCI